MSCASARFKIRAPQNAGVGQTFGLIGYLAPAFHFPPLPLFPLLSDLSTRITTERESMDNDRYNDNNESEVYSSLIFAFSFSCATRLAWTSEEDLLAPVGRGIGRPRLYA